MIERHSSAFSFKAADVGSQGEFRGYASTFGGPPDAMGDVIAKGAFTETLREHEARGTMPALLWAHHGDEPIGRWLSISEDAKGLAVTGKLSLGVRRADEAHKLLKDRALTGLSIGYRVQPSGASCDASGCLLKKLNLFEISLVAVPANPYATVTAVKSACGCASIDQLQRCDTIREVRELFRASGFSKRRADRIASATWSVLSGDDADDDETDINALAAKVNSLNSLLKGKQS